jgi:[ribosomal protein S18]-alanine N-acetyltransferase
MKENQTIAIRVVMAQDCIALAHFFKENNLSSVVRQFNPFPMNEKTARNIACTIHLDRYYIALLKDKIIGFCMLRGWDEGYFLPSFGMLVDSCYKNRGLGKRMLKFALMEAKELGCKQIKLSVYTSNTVALRLYTSFGFIESKRIPTQVMGQPDEKIIMFKEL